MSAAASGCATPVFRGSPRAVALAGALALAVAMGIGRFAFTPLLPMMLADGVVDLSAASWLASANYLGYLAGAVCCTLQPWLWSRRPNWPPIDAPRIVRAGLVATGLLTLGMALPWPGAWPTLRFAAGVASALVFVYTSGWCLALLARQNATALGGAIYTGPGAGIVVSGFFASAMVAWDWRATAGWLIFGALAFALTAAVWSTFRDGPGEAGRSDAADARAAAVNLAAAPIGDVGTGRRHGRIEIGWLALAYGIAGFGYIITATFLPVIARQALPGSQWLDLFWPVFGLGVIVGALLSTRLRVSGDLRLLLAAGYFVQATAIAASLWSPTLAGFAIGSLLLGIPFTANTFFAMQEARRLRPSGAAATMGLLTALYGVGQILGPPLAAQLMRRSGSVGAGFTLALEIAAAALLAGAVIYLGMTRAYPQRPGSKASG